jgi:hypothetical protein
MLRNAGPAHCGSAESISGCQAAFAPGRVPPAFQELAEIKSRVIRPFAAAYADKVPQHGLRASDVPAAFQQPREQLGRAPGPFAGAGLDGRQYRASTAAGSSRCSAARRSR